jgi:hypothetical protein
LGGIHRHLDPHGSADPIRDIVTAANYHLRVQASYRLFERVQPGDLDLDPRAQCPDAGRDHTSVSTIFLAESY